MAYNHKKHFVDPTHLLQETQYDDESSRICDICLLEVAGLAGYRCDDCDIDIHKACADHFEKTITFFADPHRLKLIRTPGVVERGGTYMCDLCREDCPPASFIYRCAVCDFDLHPLCSLLPETVGSPLHPGHVLRMVTSPSVSCSACHGSLPLWHYVCSCSVNFKLHIACAIVDDDEAAGAENHGGGGPAEHQSRGVNQHGHGYHGPAEHQGSHGVVNQRGFSPAAACHGGFYIDPAMIQGYSPFMHGFIPNINMPGYSPAFPGIYGPGIPVYGPPPAIPGFGPSIPGMYGAPIVPGIYGGPPIQGYGPGVPGQNNVAKQGRCSAIAKFLLKQSFGAVVDVATGGLLGSPLVDLLSAAMNN